MKRLVLLSCLFLCWTGATAQTQEPEPLSFFPHQVGDTWTYRYYHGELWNRKVEGLHFSNDTVYVDFGNTALPHFIVGGTNVYHTYGQTTEHLYKLDAKVGETWTVQPAELGENGAPRMDAIVEDIYDTYVWGIPTTIKKISYFRLLAGEDSISGQSMFLHSQWLGSGIGLIQDLFDGSSEMEYMLTGCVIDGDTLGVVTGIHEEQPVA